jgi:hypothetical protein
MKMWWISEGGKKAWEWRILSRVGGHLDLVVSASGGEFRSNVARCAGHSHFSPILKCAMHRHKMSDCQWDAHREDYLISYQLSFRYRKGKTVAERDCLVYKKSLVPMSIFHWSTTWSWSWFCVSSQSPDIVKPNFRERIQTSPIQDNECCGSSMHTSRFAYHELEMQSEHQYLFDLNVQLPWRFCHGFYISRDQILPMDPRILHA